MSTASLFRNLAAITALLYAFLALYTAPDPRQWHWGVWVVFSFMYVTLISVYFEKKIYHGCQRFDEPSLG